MIHIKIILLISLAAFVACGGGSDELPKNDGKPISEEVFDEVEVDAALGRVLHKMKSILKDKEESQTLTQLQQPLSIDTNSQERNKRTHGVGSSGVGSSSSNQPYTRTVNVGGKTTYQERYHGYIGEINQHVDGKRLTVKGDTLYIDQKVVQELMQRRGHY
ncbi:uncharacterized protein LOC126837397 [Adelges cooleyi]|uniref:uncharacterized protein LOC126837397 n=1 Tax=Adelges cooleyi TaxID=133065 RepID=UPI00217F859A|nr:uncharacterized protein LOC126837397 [Adelges cooleyi]